MQAQQLILTKRVSSPNSPVIQSNLNEKLPKAGAKGGKHYKHEITNSNISKSC